jgi:acyl carrier protein
MTTDHETLLDTLITLLSAIAPELDAGSMPPDRPLRHLVDLDSMDWLNFLVSVHEHFGVTIPEVDYAKLVTLDDLANYLQKKQV